MNANTRDRFNSATKIAGKPAYIKQNLLAQTGPSWKYIRYRIMRPLLKIYKWWLLRSYDEQVPWLTPAAISILDQLLTSDMYGLEYGSGRSTVFFASRLAHLESLEHHKEWHELVSAQLKHSELTNVTYVLKEGTRPETNKEIEARNASSFNEENEIYRSYIDHIHTYPDNSFDFILIDGRARPECSIRAIDKLKSGGIFILDNSERKRYEPVHNELRHWPQVNTTTGLTDTTFWFKP